MRKFPLFFSLLFLLVATSGHATESLSIKESKGIVNPTRLNNISNNAPTQGYLEADSSRQSNKNLLGGISKINRSIVTDTLRAFGLLSPANNSTFNIPLSGPGTLDINWRSSATVSGNPVTYEWLVDVPSGNFTNPIITLPSNNTGSDSELTIGYNQLNALLNASGVLPGQTYSVKWTVKATSGTLNRFASSFFNVNIFRINDTLITFNLLAPANNTFLNLTGSSSQTVQINWTRTRLPNSLPVTYSWLLIALNGSFANPITTILADNNGRDSVLTLTYGQIASLLASNGINPGTVFQAKWTIRATAGTAARFAATTHNLALSYNNVTSTSDPQLDRQIQLFPNPAKSGESRLRVNLEQASDLQIQITDLQGRVLSTSLVQRVSQSDLMLPTAGLRAGLYLVVVQNGNERVVRKLQLH